ncbi:MAG: hypothetical protein AB7F22_05125 [Reyranella sp.]|uniref:hypothetical protein n=1 Tax=Reyranella sp. TaxID=1929291 RepID=UPI003D14DF57
MDAVGRWDVWAVLATRLGGPWPVLEMLVLLAWVLLVAVCAAAILGAVVAEVRPWMPTAPGDEMPVLTEAEKTTLYGSQGQVVDREMEPAPRSRPRPPWLRSGRGD